MAEIETRIENLEKKANSLDNIAKVILEDVKSYRPDPPPIAKGYGSAEAVVRDPKKHRWEFAWEDDGHSVLLFRDDDPWCLVSKGDRKGYSKAVKTDGPWGHPWDDKLINSIG